MPLSNYLASDLSSTVRDRSAIYGEITRCERNSRSGGITAAVLFILRCLSLHSTTTAWLLPARLAGATDLHDFDRTERAQKVTYSVTRTPRPDGGGRLEGPDNCPAPPSSRDRHLLPERERVLLRPSGR